MIRSTDFSPRTILAAAWAPADTLQPSRLFAHALSRWDDEYDGDPIFLPAEVALPELPTASLTSRDGTRQLGIAARRINVVWQHQDGIGAPATAEVLAASAERLIELFHTANISIGRLAAVLNRIAEHENPGQALAQHFCRAGLLRGPLNRPEGFEIHAHKVYAFPSGFAHLNVNSWMRAKTAKRGGDRDYRWVLAEQDINTLEEERERRRFTEIEVREFFAHAAPELDHILELYFPADGQRGDSQ